MLFRSSHPGCLSPETLAPSFLPRAAAISLPLCFFSSIPSTPTPQAGGARRRRSRHGGRAEIVEHVDVRAELEPNDYAKDSFPFFLFFVCDTGARHGHRRPPLPTHHRHHLGTIHDTGSLWVSRRPRATPLLPIPLLWTSPSRALSPPVAVGPTPPSTGTSSGSSARPPHAH